MSEPIKLINSFTWYRGQPHQETAIQWLDRNLRDDIREEFGRRFRQKPPERSLPSIVQLEMNWTNRLDRRGFRIFRLALTNTGKEVDAIEVLSGDLPSQSSNFIRPEKDFSGSGRCLPEGVYSIGHLEDSQLIRSTPAWDNPGIGRYWISLEVLPQYKVNNRGAFGIHADANASYAPGSIGCVCPLDANGLKKILNWMSAKARPVQLVCDLKTGFLKEHGYRPPSAIAPPVARPQPVENQTEEGFDLNGLAEVTSDLERQLAHQFGVDPSTIEMLIEVVSKRLHSSSISSEFTGREIEFFENGTATDASAYIFLDAEQGVS